MPHIMFETFNDPVMNVALKTYNVPARHMTIQAEGA